MRRPGGGSVCLLQEDLGQTVAFAAIGCMAALFSLVAPKANRPIYVTLAVIALPIGFVLSYVIMGTIFYLLITPVGLVFLLTRRDSLRRSFPSRSESCWVDAPPAKQRERYFRQFCAERAPLAASGDAR